MGDPPSGYLEFDPDRQRLAKAYQREALARGVLGTLLFALIAYLALATGISVRLETWARTLSGNSWIVIGLYVLIAYLTLRLLALPLRVVARVAERRYGLSKASWAKWAITSLKSLALGLLWSLLAIEALYWAIRNFGDLWWLLVWALSLVLAVLGTLLAPVLLLPIFYRVTPVEDPAVGERFRRLAERAQVPVMGVYTFHSSALTERGTAALAGWGRTRRILLSDHMLERYTLEEVEGILAHELAHQVHRDGLWLFLSASAVSLVGLFLADGFVRATMGSFGVMGLASVATLPLFALFGMLYYTVTSPLTRAISRGRESQADARGALLSGNPRSLASALVKLHNQNLADATPSPWVETLFYTHPAGRRRVQALLEGGTPLAERGAP